MRCRIAAALLRRTEIGPDRLALTIDLCWMPEFMLFTDHPGNAAHANAGTKTGGTSAFKHQWFSQCSAGQAAPFATRFATRTAQHPIELDNSAGHRSPAKTQQTQTDEHRKRPR